MTSNPNISFGVDFDNTVAGYDAILHKIALSRQLIRKNVARSKNSIRDAIRTSKGGEVEWQKLQSLVYGPLMSEAIPNDGALDFFKECAVRDVPAFVISHKTSRASFDETGTDLREAALNWLETNSFFQHGTGLGPNMVYFEDTRSAKVSRISALRCTHFIDDLPETFQEKSFPVGVKKILYAPNKTAFMTEGVTISAWSEATALLNPIEPSRATTN